jgi:ADP-glucose pyrophosphorylase
VPEQTCPCVFGDSIGGGAHNSIVAGGCRIDGDVSDSVISPHVTVEAGACVSRSILFPGVHIEAGARVRNAILDKNVRILRGTVLGDDADFPDTYGGKVAYTPGGIAVVAKGEVVGRVHHAIGDSPREALVLDHETRDDGLPVSPDARLPLCDAAPIAAR